MGFRVLLLLVFVAVCVQRCRCEPIPQSEAVVARPLVHIGEIDGKRHLIFITIGPVGQTQRVTAVDHCLLRTTDGGGTYVPYSGGAAAVAHTRSDRLMFVGRPAPGLPWRLYYVDPKDCIVHAVGNELGASFVRGLAPAGLDDLYGVAADTGLIAIDTSSAAVNMIGSAGLALGSLGLTSIPNDANLLLADGSSGRLYSVDPATGSFSEVRRLPSATQVGLEYDPTTRALYMCNEDHILYEVPMAEDDSVQEIGAIEIMVNGQRVEFSNGCTNLGGPLSGPRPTTVDALGVTP